MFGKGLGLVSLHGTQVNELQCFYILAIKQNITQYNAKYTHCISVMANMNNILIDNKNFLMSFGVTTDYMNYLVFPQE